MMGINVITDLHPALCFAKSAACANFYAYIKPSLFIMHLKILRIKKLYKQVMKFQDIK